MAERRMFAKTIIDSDAFLDMPLSAQALYFHLSMRADDDGFLNNPKRVIRTIGGNDDDFKLLIAKKFIIIFESGVIVIKHWKMHNYIRGDRKKDTNYPEEMSLLSIKENGAYTLLDKDTQLLPQITEPSARKKAYEESELPYSFDYKIRNAFLGKPCPICGVLMQSHVEDGIATNFHKPSIQHNIPISKGGTHELGNISVICHQCNVSIKDTETGELNSREVIEVWDSLCNDGQMSVKCQSSDSVGKVRLGKDSIGKGNNTSTYEDEFEELWKLYPRKEGKTNSQKAYIKARKEGIPKETIEQGILDYCAYIRANNIEGRYIKMGSTWFNQRCWTDDHSMRVADRNDWLKEMQL